MSENVQKCPESGSHDPNSVAQDPDLQQLSHAQLIALDLLMGGAKDSMVARHLKINPRTVYRWRHDTPAFMRVLARRREEVSQFGLDRFQNVTWLALARLENLIRDPYTPISLGAARAVVSMARLGEAVSAPFFNPRNHR